MEPALVALGVALLLASLIPLSTGRVARGAGLAYLGAVAWGSGFSASTGTLLVMATAMTVLFLLAALGLGLYRAAARGRAERRTDGAPSGPAALAPYR